MDETRCRTDVHLYHGPHYMVFETVDAIRAQMGDYGTWINLTTWTGSDLMPPEQISIQISHISSLREMTEESWLYAQRSTQLHYAREIREMEQSSNEAMVEQQARLVDVLAGLRSSDD